MGGYLAAMDLVVANDSGSVHMAAAVGTPSVVVFGPTDPRRTGPYGEGHCVVAAEAPCRPCFKRVCRVNGRPCLEQLAPQRVIDAALGLLERARP